MTSPPSRSAAVAEPASPGRREAAPEREAAPDRHLQVVGRRPRRSRARAVGCAIAVIVIGALFLNAVAHAVLVGGQEKLDHLKADVAAEQTRNQRLRLHQAELQAPDRVVAKAKARGMIVPSSVHWITPKPDGTAVVSDSTTPAPPAPPPTTVAVSTPPAPDPERASADPQQPPPTTGRAPSNATGASGPDGADRP
jgi:hypothetical protein